VDTTVKWATKSSAKGIEPMEQQASVVMLFAATCETLMSSTIDAVMRDHRPDKEAWISAAEMYKSCFLFIELVIEDSGVARQLNALGTLACILASNDELAVSSLSGNVTTSDLPEAASTLVEAVAAYKSSQLEGPGQAAALYRLGEALLRLLPYWPRDAESTRPAMERIASLLRLATEQFLDRGVAVEAIGPAASFVGVCDHLARTFEQSHSAIDAVRVAERVVSANSTVSGESAMGLAALCSNSVGAAKWLAQRHEGADFLASALALAYHLKRSVEGVLSNTHPDVVMHLTEGCLRNLVELHALLAIQGGAGSQEHAISARDSLNELERFALAQRDRDITLRAKTFVRHFSRLLQQQDRQVDEAPSVSAERLREQYVSTAEDVVRSVIALRDPERQRATLAEALERWYADLTAAMERVIDEIGFSHHVCRIVLALGALGSGKFGGLSSQAALGLILAVPGEKDVAPIVSTSDWRQQIWALDGQETEIEILGRIAGLSTLHTQMSGLRDLTSTLLSLTRAENRKLLARIIRSSNTARIMPEPLGSRFVDVESMLSMLPDAVRTAAIHGYSGSGSPLQASLSDADLRIVRARGPRSGDRAADISAEELIKRTERTESLIEKGWEGVPQLKFEAVDDQPGESASDDLSPGTMFKLDGRLKRIEGILGEGREKIVYELTDVETGEKLALQRFRDDSAVILRRRLNELVKDLDGNADAVIATCDQLLQIDPTDETAAYNKGVVLLVGKKEYERALECFDKAAGRSPGDILNILHRAAALAYLELNVESLGDVARAIEISSTDAAVCMQQLPWLAQVIADAAHATRAHDEQADLASHILEWLSVVQAAPSRRGGRRSRGKTVREWLDRLHQSRFGWFSRL
jgi:hypothetical protein